MTKQDWLKLLIEVELNKVLTEQEGTEDAPFGKYLWADDQMSVQSRFDFASDPARRVRKDDVKEPNTKAEAEFYAAYMKHVGSEGNEASKDFGRIINKFLRPLLDQGLYTEFIAPPSGPLYRGMRLSVKQAAKFLRLSPREILEDRKQAWYVEGGGIIPAKANQVMSWTTRPETAYEFAEVLMQDEIPVIFVAYPEKGGNFFLNPRNLLKKFDFGNNTGTIEDEMEVVSVGPCPFQEAAYYNNIDPEKMGRPSQDQITKLAKAITLQIQAILESSDKPEDMAATEALLNEVVNTIIEDSFKEYPFLKHLSLEQRNEAEERLNKMLRINDLPKRLLRGGDLKGFLWIWENQLRNILGDMDYHANKSSKIGTLQFDDIQKSLFRALAIKKKKNE